MGFGLLVAIRWIFQIAWIGALIPESSDMGVVVPLLFVAVGICCVAMPRPRPRNTALDRVVLGCVGLILLLPALNLVQQVFGVNLGIDFVRVPTAPTHAIPHPGRMAPNTAIGFFCAGVALVLLWRPRPTIRWAVTAWVAALTLIGLAGLVGHFLQLESLYQIANFNRMLVPTAVGLTLLSLALWLLQDCAAPLEHQANRQMARVTYRSIAVLTLVTVAGGVAGFSVLRDVFEQALAQNLRVTASTSAVALANALDGGLLFPRTIASRPAVRMTLAKLVADPDDKAASEFITKVAESFLMAGVDGVAFYSPAGQRVGSAGAMRTRPALTRSPLKAEGLTAFLLWQDGFFLESETEVSLDGRVVGRLKTEQRLRFFDQLLSQIRTGSDSSDALICTRDGDDAFCAPTRLYREPVRIPMFKPNGELNLPINRALAGQSGVLRTKDIRGVDVLAAYTLIAADLAIVVKTDIDTLYAPMKQRVKLLALLLVSLVAVGTYALRLRVRPMLGQILAEKERTRVILDNSNDAFVALGSEGTVTDWNRQAETTFGWTAAQALGQRLSDLIIPPEDHEAHEERMRRFAALGTDLIVNRRIEVNALHRDGHRFPVEMSVTGYHDGQGYVSNTFMRDISERRADQQRVVASEQRLRDVTNSIPALVGYFDADERCQFANDMALKVHGLERGEEARLSMRIALGDAMYALHEPHLRRALNGQRSSFNGTRVYKGKDTHFQANFVPDTDHDGNVVGVYLMTFDVTALKEAQLRQERSERRLRDITDNLPVMISYIDSAERLTFLNKTFTTWTGIDHLVAVGRRLVDVIGPELYEQRRTYLAQGLGGMRVAFELEATTLGIDRCLNTEYVPDVQPDGTVAGVYTMSTDVTALKAIERQLSLLARFDTLTGLANRHVFNEKLGEALARAARNGMAVALMFLDIDRFKSINDEFGHACGDAALKEFALRLLQGVRATDTVARLAGDEFVVILEGLNDRNEPRRIASNVMALINRPFDIDGRQHSITTSIGVAFHTGGLVSGEELLARADAALYEAKGAGRNTCALAAS